ncbi:hypothetical protein [Planotetraspora sp. GP83]|uniref:hypothetical protein n=1 Tax=Planotetraspora sp. GP83 TaxID=3156264 RepID=UPI0035113067
MGDDVIQVCIHPVLRAPLEQWLADRGLHLFRMPDFPDDLPTYGIGIGTRVRPGTTAPVALDQPFDDCTAPASTTEEGNPHA